MVQKIVAEGILLTRQVAYMLIVEINIDHIPILGIGLDLVCNSG